MPTLPKRKLGKRIGGASEGDVYLSGQDVTKMLHPKLSQGVNRNVSIAEQKMRFYSHKIGHLLFPHHVLDVHSVVTRPSGIFISSKFRPGVRVPPKYLPEAHRVHTTLLDAGISCDAGSKEPNYVLSGGKILFYEVTSLEPNKVLKHLESRSDLDQHKRERIKFLLLQYRRNWKDYCEQARKRWEAKSLERMERTKR